MVTKRRVPLTTIVLAASSPAVRRGTTDAGTTCLLVSLICVKLPVRSSELGMLFDLIRTGAKTQRRSKDIRKNVFFPANGTGPPNEPPSSFRLKYGLGNVGTALVGKKLASSNLSCSVHAASAEFLLL